MIIYILTVYLFIGGLIAVKYYKEEGKHERLLDGIAIASIVSIFGPIVVAYLATKNVIVRFNLWRKNRDTSR